MSDSGEAAQSVARGKQNQNVESRELETFEGDRNSLVSSFQFVRALALGLALHSSQPRLMLSHARARIALLSCARVGGRRPSPVTRRRKRHIMCFIQCVACSGEHIAAALLADGMSPRVR